DARARVRRSQELVTENAEAADLLRRIDRAQQAKRQQLGEREKAAGFKLLAEKKFRKSLDALQRASEILGADATLRVGIEEAGQEKEKREKIATLLAESEQALLQEEYQCAAVRAKEVFLLEPKSARAEQLLKRIEEAEALKRRQDQVRLLLSQGQNALTADNLTEAANHAREALRLDTGNVEATNLLQGIEQLREKRKKARINALLSKGRQALSRDDFEEAGRLAQEVISVDSGNADATNLLQGIEEAREKRKRDQIAKLLFECQQARETKKFDEAAGQAQSTTELDPKNNEARSLLKQMPKYVST